MKQYSADQLVALGKVVGVFGVLGWIRIQCHADEAESWLDLNPWFFMREEVALAEEVVAADGIEPAEDVEPSDKVDVANSNKANVNKAKHADKTHGAGNIQRCEVVEWRWHGRVVIAALKGVTDRDVAMTYRGLLLCQPRALLPEPQDGHYYWTDLIGCQVENLQGANLGQVTSLMETGANDVLVVEGNKTQRLLPFVPSVVQQVKLQERQLIVDWQQDW